MTKMLSAATLLVLQGNSGRGIIVHKISPRGLVMTFDNAMKFRADLTWSFTAPLIFVILWSSGFTFAKMGLVHANPFTLLALRYALVVVVLSPIYFILRPPLPRKRMDWVHQGVVGFLIQAMFFGFVYTAVTHGVSAGGMGLIFSLQPIFVAILAPRLTGELIGIKIWIGLVLGLIGTGLVIFARSMVEVASVFGYCIAICATLSMTAATLYEKRFGVSWHPILSNLAQCGVGLLVAFPIGWFYEGFSIEWSTELLIALFYLVVCNSLIAITLLLAMIRRGKASKASALFFLVPPTSAVVAWLLIGEMIPPLAWVGMVIATIGVAIVVARKFDGNDNSKKI